MKKPRNFIDLTGKKYENFTVIEQGKGRYTSGGQYKATWICKCICGKTFEVDGEKIRRGSVYSCGCMRYEKRDRFYENLVGKRYGRLTVIRRLRSEEVETVQYNWLCQCDCGKFIKASANKLKTGHTRSCGCLKKEFSIGDATRKHGMRHTRLYDVYASMKRRCLDPHAENYKYYGAKGVEVCREWLGEHGFESFYEWAISAGYDSSKHWTEMTIDRIDPHGDYCPRNCRWTDIKTQALNKRKK